MAILAAWFWAFTLFDTMGDAIGPTKASGIVVAMCVSPFLWQALFWLVRRIQPAKQVMETKTQDNPLVASSMRESELVPLPSTANGSV